MQRSTLLRASVALLMPISLVGIGYNAMRPATAPESEPTPIEAMMYTEEALDEHGEHTDDFDADMLEAVDEVQAAAPAETATIDPPTPQPIPEPTPKPMTYSVPTEFPGILPDNELHGKQVRISTPKGDIVFEVFSQEAPKAASNMIALARSGFYDGIIFHRVEPGFVVQGGDPQGMGYGGPGYRFEDEPVTRDYTRGIVAMANAGPNTNGSQFFIVLRDQPLMSKLYTVFGRVTSGMDVVDSIAIGDVMTKVTVEDRR